MNGAITSKCPNASPEARYCNIIGKTLDYFLHIKLQEEDCRKNSCSSGSTPILRPIPC